MRWTSWACRPGRTTASCGWRGPSRISTVQRTSSRRTWWRRLGIGVWIGSCGRGKCSSTCYDQVCGLPSYDGGESMPIHDWTRVPAGIFHHFHHEWISAMSNALNAGLLPSPYYALAEQQASGFGPDVITLQGQSTPDDEATGGVLLASPKVRFQAE